MSQKLQKILTIGIVFSGTGFYFAGLFLPMATFTKKMLPFINSTEQYNLIRTIRELFHNGDYPLGVILVLFTFVFPVTKFFSLFMVLFGGWNEENSRLYRWMKATGRWSMLDVFVVAILVVMLKVRTMNIDFSMAPNIGIYCFGASVLSAIWAGNRLAKRQRSQQRA